MESWTEMNDTEKEVRELILPLFDGVHLHLIDLELRGKSGSQVVSVYADTREGITLDEITRLTREINDLLDMHVWMCPRPASTGRYRRCGNLKKISEEISG
jgi:ribosome maturation factor RimP